MTQAHDLLDLAKGCGVSIATAESCTAGLLSGAITAVPGSSAIFDRGFVTYTNAAKVQMLGVAQATLDQWGAVSEDVACEMAAGALARSAAQIAVAITGIAGPGGSDHKPEGRVCFAVATAQGCTAQTVEWGPIGRDRVRAASVDHALTLLLDRLSAWPDGQATP